MTSTRRLFVLLLGSGLLPVGARAKKKKPAPPPTPQQKLTRFVDLVFKDLGDPANNQIKPEELEALIREFSAMAGTDREEFGRFGFNVGGELRNILHQKRSYLKDYASAKGLVVGSLGERKYAGGTHPWYYTEDYYRQKDREAHNAALEAKRKERQKRMRAMSADQIAKKWDVLARTHRPRFNQALVHLERLAREAEEAAANPPAGSE